MVESMRLEAISPQSMSVFFFFLAVTHISYRILRRMLPPKKILYFFALIFPLFGLPYPSIGVPHSFHNPPTPADPRSSGSTVGHMGAISRSQRDRGTPTTALAVVTVSSSPVFIIFIVFIFFFFII